MVSPSKSPHSKFLGVGSSSNSRSMSEPSPNSANRSVNPSLPDVTEGIYATDEFRMYSCKVEKCPYDGSPHNWKQCPYTHTGDRARRRDPKKYSYKHTPCPYFTQPGSCYDGDRCGKAHGEFERRLHPDLYRTELCQVEPPCTRLICFYAHTQEELRKTSSSLSAYSRCLADVFEGFEPAPCPVPDFPSTPVTLPKTPSTIDMSKNAPNNPLESSDEQNLPSQPSLSAANSPSPASSTFPNVKDGFPEKKIRRYSDLFKPPSKLAATDQSQKQKQSMQSSSKTDFSPTHVNHFHPCLSESPSTTGISNNDPDKPLEGLSSNEQSLLPQLSLSESTSTIPISNSAPDNNPLEGLSSNEQSLSPQPSLRESPSIIEISNNAPYEPLEGSSSNEQSLQSQKSLSESLSTIRISNNDPDNPLEGLSSKEQSLLPQPSLSKSPSTILISDSTPDVPLEGSSSNEQSRLFSFSSNMEDGFPGKHYHTYYEPFSPILASTDQSRKQKQSMLSRSRTDFSPRNVNQSLSQPLIGVTTEPAFPTNSQVSMPALQATQPQQTPGPSSSNLVYNSSAADNCSDDYYGTWYEQKPDVNWVEALLHEPAEDYVLPPAEDYLLPAADYLLPPAEDYLLPFLPAEDYFQLLLPAPTSKSPSKDAQSKQQNE